MIQIVDTGEGISREHFKKLFEPFFTTKRDRKGTGLGLSISKMIVDKHRGNFLIDSEPGKGTDVRLFFAPD
jgi:signal transduction histidine kinase